jgi:hypothetical protein
MSENKQDDSTEPPKEILVAPSSLKTEDKSLWKVIAKNRRVNRSWEELIQKDLESARRCYEHLKNNPLQRKPGRIFPLKGKKYKGNWEYEFNSGDRVFYTPNPEKMEVVVYYAGEHTKPAPIP